MAKVSIEELIGYRFRDTDLLREALTHKSYAFERGDARHNERLEFLGDSVLAAVVAHWLFELYPDEDEGHLSKMKSTLVSRSTLGEWARQMELGSHLLLGLGEESTRGRDRPSTLSNALEALMGAIYIDGGYKPANHFIRHFLLKERTRIIETDYKSHLQELVQKRYKIPPDYTLVKTTGPEHDKVFAVKVHLGERMLGSGRGKSKKEAQQAAAKDALRRLMH